jgi:AAA-like domain
VEFEQPDYSQRLDFGRSAVVPIMIEGVEIGAIDVNSILPLNNFNLVSFINLLTLDELTETAVADAGIYSDHLRRQLWNLEEYPELAAGMREIATADNPVQ